MSARLSDPIPSYVPEIEPPFFPVSIGKLVVLSICTIGFYDLYWFYMNWRFIKSRERSTLSPTLRGVLFVAFFCYPCFRRIRDFDAAPKPVGRLTAGPLAIGWICTALLGVLPGSLCFLSLLAVVFLIPVQREVNRINRIAVPDHDPNRRFTLANWITIAIGGTFLLLLIAVTVLVDVPRS